jgi:hypothetical protein
MEGSIDGTCEGSNDTEGFPDGDAEVDGLGDEVNDEVGIPVIPKQHSRNTLLIVGQQSPERLKHAGCAKHLESLGPPDGPSDVEGTKVGTVLPERSSLEGEGTREGVSSPPRRVDLPRRPSLPMRRRAFLCLSFAFPLT